MAALLGVLIFDTLPGLFIGVAVSFVLLVYRAYRPHLAVMGRSPVTGTFADVDRDPDVEVVPGIVVVRPEAGLFFANAEAVRDGVLAQVERSGATAVVLPAELGPDDVLPWIADERITILNATGLHRPNLGDELVDVGEGLFVLEPEDGGRGAVALVEGWQAELRSLRHYLERHRGRDRTFRLAWLTTPLARDAAWSRLLGPGGFGVSPAEPKPGGPYEVVTPGGQRFSGTVELYLPGQTLTGTARELDDGWFRLLTWAAPGGETGVWAGLATYAGDAGPVTEFRDRAQEALQRLFPAS